MATSATPLSYPGTVFKFVPFKETKPFLLHDVQPRSQAIIFLYILYWMWSKISKIHCNTLSHSVDDNLNTKISMQNNCPRQQPTGVLCAHLYTMLLVCRSVLSSVSSAYGGVTGASKLRVRPSVFLWRGAISREPPSRFDFQGHGNFRTSGLRALPVSV